MISDQQIDELIEEVRKMRVEIPNEPELYHTTIMAIHGFLNELTEIKIMIAQDILRNPTDKDYLAKLRLISREVVEPALRQLTVGKQTFGMLINKGKNFGDERGRRIKLNAEELAKEELKKLLETPEKKIDSSTSIGDNGFDFGD